MLKSRAYYEYILQGYILGNNVNIFTPDAESGFTGAVVGNPLLNSHTGYKLFGRHSMYVFDNVIDIDFSSMYPHIIIAHNIDRCSMIGKLIIPSISEDTYGHMFVDDKIVDRLDEDEDEDDETELNTLNMGYDSGKDFMDNYLTGDVLSVGNKWFNLPDVNTLQEDFRKEFKIKPRKRFIINYVKKLFIGEPIEIDID